MPLDTEPLAEPAAPPAQGDGAQPTVPSLDAPAPAGGAVSEWNGERETLSREPWWNEIPETTRASVERGIATKYANFHRGADQARQAAATKVADLEKRLAETSTKSDYWSKLLSEDDATKPLAEKVASLEAALSERDTRLADYESRVVQAETARTLSTHEAKYPDIYADFADDPDWVPGSATPPRPTGAYADFITLTQAGIPEDRAARMVRATMAQPPAAPAPVAAPAPPPRVVIPPSVAAASNGAGPSPARVVRETDEDYDTLMLRKRREAEQDDE